MKRSLVIILVCFSVFVLCGCCLFHEWQEATCTLPRTCSKCGKTEGEALGHTWEEATCTKPKTCSICGQTEGKSLGHTWEEATCTTAKTCSVCGETQGKALGHEWKEATCQNVKTCLRCGLQEGKLGGHNWTDATCFEPKTCSVCGKTEGEPLGHEWKEVTYVMPKHCERCGETDGERLKLSGNELVNELKKRGYKTTTVSDAWGTYFALVLPVSGDSFLLDLDIKSFYARTHHQVLTVNEWSFMKGTRWTYNTEPTTLSFEEQRNEILNLAVCVADILGESISAEDFLLVENAVPPKQRVETEGATYSVEASILIVNIKDKT